MADDVGSNVGNRDDGRDNAGNFAGEGDGVEAGREGGILAEYAAVVAAVVAMTAVVAAAHCRGHLLFIVKIFLCSIFMSGGNWQVTSCLRYVGVLLGWDGNSPLKLWYVNTKNYLAKKHGNQCW
jgi:hypothetical protein